MCGLFFLRSFLDEQNNLYSQSYKKWIHVLLEKHIGSLHPAWHPPIHVPVIWSHLSGTAQLTLHLFSQLSPYNPSGHAVK